MKKRRISFIFIVIFLLLCVSFPMTVLGAEKKEENNFNQTIDQQISSLDLEKLQEYIDSLDENTKNLLGAGDLKEKFKQLLSGDLQLSYSSIGSYLLKTLFSYLTAMLPVFITIAGICIFSGLMDGMQPKLLTKSQNNLVFFVCYSAVILLLLTSVFAMISITKSSIERMTKQMDLLFPILLTLMTASGGTVSASVYRPAVAFLSVGISNVFLQIVLPITALIIVFTVIANLSPAVRLHKFCDFFKSCNKWTIGLCLTIFTLFMTIQGITSAGFDGVSLRAAKYAIGNSIPIIGGFLKDGVDLVLAGCVLIKNAIGIWGIVLIFATILVPALQLVVYSLFLKLTAGVTEPVSDPRISSFISGLSGGINYLIASIFCVGFMFFLSIFLLICSSHVFF